MPALAVRVVTRLEDDDDVLLTSAARGDVLYRGASQWNNLAAGTAGNVLQTAGAGADPLWGTLAFDNLSDVTLTGAAQGDVLYRNATEWVNLGPGTSGQFLKTNGAGANPAWAAATASIGGTITSGTVGSVLFVGTGPVFAQDNANFFWNDADNSLQLAAAPPADATKASLRFGGALSGGDADGTYVGINAAAAYAGNFFDFQVNGTRVYRLDGAGKAYVSELAIGTNELVLRQNPSFPFQFEFTTHTTIAAGLLFAAGGAALSDVAAVFYSPSLTGAAVQMRGFAGQAVEILTIQGQPSGLMDYIVMQPDGSVAAEGGGIGIRWRGEPTAQTGMLNVARIYAQFDGNAFDTERLTIQSMVGGAITDTLSSKSGSIGIRENTPGARLHVNTAEATAIGVIVKAFASQSANIWEGRKSDDTVYGTMSENGYWTTRKVAAPADAELATSEAAWWFDATPGSAKLMVKAKNSSGTVVTGSVTLT